MSPLTREPARSLQVGSPPAFPDGKRAPLPSHALENTAIGPVLAILSYSLAEFRKACILQLLYAKKLTQDFCIMRPINVSIPLSNLALWCG